VVPGVLGEERAAAGRADRPGSDGLEAGRRHRRWRLSISAPPPPFFPRTFQGRLSMAFVVVFALAIGMVSVVTVFVLDGDLRQQEEFNLAARANAVADVVRVRAESTAQEDPADLTVVSAGDRLNPLVALELGDPLTMDDYANNVAQADLSLRFGLGTDTPQGIGFIPAGPTSTFTGALTAAPGQGQARDPISYTEIFRFPDEAGVKPTWYLEVTLSAPYTTRASTIAGVIGVLLAMSAVALSLSVVMSALLARRFTQPLRRLTEAARALAEGELSRRVPADGAMTGAKEITELSHQFNAMAHQVEETMEVIRRDRDASREFLADVSHELRTPLAALRTFNELLREKAGSDAAARAEFLEASGQQIERLDWLAQNLLELSKLDSGLVRLDLRPDDLGATVQSAVEQALVSANRRGIDLRVELPDRPLVIRHDPQRMGQVLGNLIGNALKFTPRGGSVTVTLNPQPKGARIQVADTGVGIAAGELPHIFDRFYRGSRASEARSSGSGLGLAIVRSVVDMHNGRVMVESRLGAGSTFTVTLPLDPRTVGEAVAAPAKPASGRAGKKSRAAAARDSAREPARPAVSDPTEGASTR
jgi:signal transduction histidine kinase